LGKGWGYINSPASAKEEEKVIKDCVHGKADFAEESFPKTIFRKAMVLKRDCGLFFNATLGAC
jgi:hypothetical protein